jgi:hypothetical protein
MMRQAALRVAGYRFRATLGRRWTGYLAVTLLVGLVGGVALGSLTAARRTYASYPAFLASTNPSDLFVLPQTSSPEPGLVNRLARLPHVRSAEEGEVINAATLTPRGKIQTILETQVELVASPDGLFTEQDKLRIIQGRAADPARADEVVATNEAASVLHLHVGEQIPVGIVQNSSQNGSQNEQLYRRAKLTVVGIGVLGIQLVHDDIDSNRAGFLVGTPALLRRYESCCAANSYDGLQLDGGSRYASPVLQGYERLIDNPALSHGQLVVYQTAAIEAEAQQAIRPEAIALAVFGVIALVAALIIGTQAVSRQLHGNAGDTEVLRALGAGPATTMADGLLGVWAAASAGAVLAAAVAVGLSPLTLFGPVRTVEAAPGIDADWAVLGPGMAVLALVLALVAAGIAYRLAPQRVARRAGTAGRGSSVVGAALAAGLPVTGGAGLRFALEPGRGRTAVPVRSVIAGTVLAVLVGITTLTFGASLSTLISHPSLYGWNFDYALYSVDGYGPVPSRWTDPLLARDRDVAAATGAYFATVQIDGQTVPGIAVSTPAAITPSPLTGSKLAGAGQIVLGPATLAALHKRVGDTVTVSEGQIIPPTRLRIAGTAALPTIGDVIGVHASLSTGAIISTRSLPRADLTTYGPFSGPNAVFIRLRPGVSQAAGMRSLDKIAAELNHDSRQPLVKSLFGDVFQYINLVSVLPVQRPAEIVNYKTMGAMPAVLAGGLAAGAVAGLGLTLVASVRRRRRDFATLKTLGFTRGQLAAAVAWQSSVVAAVGLVVGVPLGIAVGRWLWLAFARELSAVPDPVIPAGSIALAAVAALVLANLVAALPGRAAARTPAAIVLRAE